MKNSRRLRVRTGADLRRKLDSPSTQLERLLGSSQATINPEMTDEAKDQIAKKRIPTVRKFL